MRLDHAVLAVQDLDSASASFEGLGFTLKPGRRHANGLLNRHIETRDGGSLELMTVIGRPGDAVAREYAGFLSDAEGGVFVAVVADVERFATVAREAGVAVELHGGGGFQYATPPDVGLSALFAVDYEDPPDSPAVLEHVNGVTAMTEVWVEAHPRLGWLLEALGGRDCGFARAPWGETGHRYGIRGGAVVVVGIRDPRRPRVRGGGVRDRGRRSRRDGC